MAKGSVARRGVGRAHSVILLMLLLAGCGARFGGPAPVVNGGELPSAQIPAQILIEPGQTLSGIAHRYHVPMQMIAEANHLSPPYRILAGGTLVIPGGGLGGPQVAVAPTSGMTAPGSPVAAVPEAPVATASLPPPQPPELASRTAPPMPDRPVPLVRPAPAAPHPQIASRAMPAPSATLMLPSPTPPSTPPGQPAASAHSEAPRAQAEPPAATHPPGAPAGAAPGAVAAAEPPPAAPPAAHRGGTFLWPVRGHILENYGTGPDGTHNDGINIAAARGAPVQATDAGVVAYAGNELRGYGNLVLIKHPNGWISAYAHCDLILVKTGQKVARGQVIARVGSTGNVSEPQLHFELRRGKRPVDPRDYLAPLPSAATRAPRAG